MAGNKEPMKVAVRLTETLVKVDAKSGAVVEERETVTYTDLEGNRLELTEFEGLEVADAARKHRP